MEQALRQIVKYTRECSEPDGWLAFNVRQAAEIALPQDSSLMPTKEG